MIECVEGIICIRQAYILVMGSNKLDRRVLSWKREKAMRFG